MKIELIQTDICSIKADAIVNAANNSLTGGGGVDGAIHRAAGPELRAFCIGLKGCKTGEAKITPGFYLPARYIIHAVGPVWNNDTENETALLSQCYQHSLQLAVEHECTSIAFPCISTGAYRFPFQKAGEIAMSVIDAFLQQNHQLQKVWLVVYDEHDYHQYQRIFQQYFKSRQHE